jgi:hypothetical protein
MSQSENFLARWSRLKRESAEAVQSVDVPAAPAFDPASLPSIESIDATTDIRPFLDACVPEELTRAALRSTWSADPAIRDFVGIAESQWDFNDPASIPGFGVHAAADYLGSLVVDDVGSPVPAGGLPPESQDAVPICSDPADVAGQITAAMPDSAHGAIGTPAGDTRDSEPRLARAHGGALPE